MCHRRKQGLEQEDVHVLSIMRSLHQLGEQCCDAFEKRGVAAAQQVLEEYKKKHGIAP